MKNRSENLENLAVRFRANCPNLACADTWNAIAAIDGGVAILYGQWLASRRHRHVSRDLRERIALTLDAIAASR